MPNFLRISVLVLLITLISTAPSFVSAQTVDDALNSAPGEMIANINLSDAALEMVSDDTAKISFVLENLADKPEYGIRYGLEIFRQAEDGGQAMVDTLVVPGEVTVLPGQPLPLVVEYAVPELASGVYQVWVNARTEGGVLLGVGRAGEITTAGEEALELVAESCYLTVADESDTYTIMQGIDVGKDERFVLHCVVKNHATEAREATPAFATYRRTIYGDEVMAVVENPETIQMSAGEEKEVVMELPKAANPQAYDLVVSLTSGVVRSNQVVIHYVLQGQSATIQTVNLNAVEYAAGEPIVVTVFWSEAADTFDEARSLGTKATEEYLIEATVTNKAGEVCGVGTVQAAMPAVSSLTVQSQIDCTEPTATVALRTVSGVALDERTVSAPSNEVVMEEVSTTTTEQVPKYFWMVLVALTFTLLVVVLAYWRRHHTNIDAPLKSFIVFALFGISVLAGAQPAEAVTWSISREVLVGGGESGESSYVNQTVLTATVNANKTTFAPGETITLSGSAQNHVCSNLYYGVSASLDGVGKTFFEGRNAGTYNFSDTFTAPATPGTYRIGLGACYTNIRNCASSHIDITVVNPAVNGRCNANHYSCSAGTSASGRDNATNYTWRCDGLHGGSNASCSETKINAVCSTANACAPGNLSGPTQSATQYFWNCLSPNGGSNASCSAYIPPTVDLVATPARMGPGATSTLSWTVTNAPQGCTASSNPTGWSGNKSNTTGTESVSPMNTTTYTLTCTGPGGTVSDSATVTMPSGSLTATSCPIAPEGTGCNSTVTWSSSNFLGAAHLLLGTTTLSTAGPNNPITVRSVMVNPSNRTLKLDDYGSAFELTANAVATCTGNSMWSDLARRCILRPTITIDADPDVVRSGETADISVVVDSAYDLTCTLRGGLNVTFPHLAADGVRQTHPYITNPLTAAQITEISCEVDAYPDVETTVDTRINVVPTIEEI